MGTGAHASDESAAWFRSVQHANGPQPSMTNIWTDDSRYYSVLSVDERTLRFGGPGAC
jgi:hypothetical protein